MRQQTHVPNHIDERNVFKIKYDAGIHFQAKKISQKNRALGLMHGFIMCTLDGSNRLNHI
jgi:hypothetical protein